MRRWIILAASVIVSGVFLWLALRGVPFAEVIDGIRQANLFWVIVSMICILGAQGSRAIRWRGLLDNRVPLVRSFHILNLTMLVNQLPLRAGKSRAACWRRAPASRWSRRRPASSSSA